MDGEGKQSSPQEIRSTNYFIPLIHLGEGVSQQTSDEVRRVAIESLKHLNIPMDIFEIPWNPTNLIDVNALSEDNLHTFPRFNPETTNVPVIILTHLPIYGPDRHEEIAIYNNENAVIMISLKNTQRHIDSEKRQIKETDIVVSSSVLNSGPQLAGIITIEEMIHFVQDKYWHRDFSGNTSSAMSPEEHDSNEIEAEAKQWKKKLINEIYPNMLKN